MFLSGLHHNYGVLKELGKFEKELLLFNQLDYKGFKFSSNGTFFHSCIREFS